MQHKYIIIKKKDRESLGGLVGYYCCGLVGFFLQLGLVSVYCWGLVGFYCWWAGGSLLLWLVVRQVSSKPNPLDQDSPDHVQTHGIR